MEFYSLFFIFYNEWKLLLLNIEKKILGKFILEVK